MRILSLRIKLILGIALTILTFWQINKLFNIYSERSLMKGSMDRINYPQQILITVYYEALCPDSRSFVITQLVPTFNTLGDNVRVQLIPFGKADTIVTNNDYIFKCQHGEPECEANIIHACTIEKIKDTRRHLDAVACMIKNNINPMSVFKHCTGNLPEFEAILSCSQSIEGRRLLAKHGEQTKALRPRISFIPTITLDHSLDNQIMILKNLLHQVCLKFLEPPRICNEV